MVFNTSWDDVGERLYETGVDRGVLYIPTGGIYDTGVPWNGLTTLTEAPSGAAATPLYADNIKYLNLISAEQFGGTIEAFTYPDEFAQCDGTALPETGIAVGQQARHQFGLSYRTQLGNDEDGSDHGYKLHLVYGCIAEPSQKAYATINDSPAAIAFSWTFSTTPVNVTGLKPTSLLVVNSLEVSSGDLLAIENELYGTGGTGARLPLPDEIIAIAAGAQTVVTTTAPTFVAGTGVITIPTVTGVTYRREDTEGVVTGTVTIATSGDSLTIRAFPSSGSYVLSPASDDDWTFTRS